MGRVSVLSEGEEIIKQNLPVIFIHNGKQGYLKDTVRLAQKYNENVILLGDASNAHICRNWVNTSKLSNSKFDIFKKSYIHLSPNSYQYELFCFQRYFLLEAYMELGEIEECVMLDSDVCTFVNYSTMGFQQYDVAASCMYYHDDTKWMAVPHVTYWKIEQLRDFTNYLIEQYRDDSKKLTDKYETLLRDKASYGISDMSLLYLWITGKERKFWNLAIAQNGRTFDVFLNTSVNCDGIPFQMTHGIKRIVFHDKIPYFITEDNVEIRANVIHAQGDRKKYIHMIASEHYTVLGLYCSEVIFKIQKTIERGKRFIGRYIGNGRRMK